MATDLISRETALEALEKTKVTVYGMRVGKIILKEYTNQIRDGYIDILRNVVPEADADFIHHGAWVTVGKSEKGSVIRMRSYCGTERTGISKSKYCRDCGALMDLPFMTMDQQSFDI